MSVRTLKAPQKTAGGENTENTTAGSVQLQGTVTPVSDVPFGKINLRFLLVFGFVFNPSEESFYYAIAENAFGFLYIVTRRVVYYLLRNGGET